MAWAKPMRITSWSFSRYSVWQQCPLKAKLKFLDKLEEPGSPAMERGNDIHKGIEGYIKGATSRLNKEWNAKAFGDTLKGLRGRYKKNPSSLLVEETLAYRDDFTLTRWDDWNGCWLRVKVDVAEIDGTEDHPHISILDWKTGRYRPADESSYTLQLDLYALGALLRYPNAKDITVQPSLVYIDEGIRHTVGEYTKADLPRLKKEWLARVKPMLADTKFAPKPNRFCNYCHFRASNGGPCKF